MTTDAALRRRYDPFRGDPLLAERQERQPGPRRRRQLMRLHQRRLDASLARLGALACDESTPPDVLIDRFRHATLAALNAFAQCLTVPSDDADSE